MRIALVSGEDPGWGGIGTYSGILAHALAAAGHDVHLVLRGWEPEAARECDGITVHRVLVPDPGWRRGTVTAIERLYSTREAVRFATGVARCVAAIAPEVIEVPEFGAPGLFAAVRAGARRGAPVIVRLHGPTFLTTELAGGARTLDTRALGALEAGTAHAATLVTAPSRAIARLVTERWRLRSRAIVVVPNPIDAHRFAPGPDDDRPGRHQVGDRGAPTVLVVGRVERSKGQDRVLDALPAILAEVPEARVRMVGEDGGMAEAIARRAEALGVAGRVELAGAIPRTELPAAYRAATVCVVPSRFENFPYTCLEAMACGRPVVAARVGGLEEIVTDGATGRLVDADRPEVVAGAIVALLRDADARARLGAAARNHVLATYAAPAVAQRTADEYGKLVA